MKLFSLLGVFVFALAFVSPALAQDTWKADPQHSRIGFAITHLGISEVSGLFKKFDVTITAAKPDFSDAVFVLDIDAASIDTEVEKRDNHLRSADFFDVAKHATITFKSRTIEPASGEGRYKLAGELTMHGVSRPVEMELWYRGTTKNQKNTTAGFQLKGTLKRSDFGIGPKFQPPMIGDEVKIKADGEFILQQK